MILFLYSMIDNMDSICELGILSFNRASKILHKSIAMNEIQDKRIKVAVPFSDGKGRPLHDFAPLYFDSWNPMLSKKRKDNEIICIIAVNKRILEKPGVVIADRNASSKYCKFAAAPGGLENIEKESVFMRNWKDQNLIVEWEKKSRKCAEALVPERVPPEHFKGFVVYNDNSAMKLEEKVGNKIAKLKLIIDSERFF